MDEKEVDPFYFTLPSLTFIALTAKAGPWHFPAQQVQGWVMKRCFQWAGSRWAHFLMFPQAALMLNAMPPSQYPENIQSDTEVVRAVVSGHCRRLSPSTGDGKMEELGSEYGRIILNNVDC